jgi:energy-coupling factor transporter ATP-binding protein EcfA2
MTQIIMISGKAGTGKSTTAKILQGIFSARGKGAVTRSFASNIKRIARDQFGWDGVKDEKGRKLLQDIGAMGRAYDPDIWPKKLIFDLKDELYFQEHDFILIDDWRFPNEGYYMADNTHMPVYCVRLEAPAREILRGTPLFDDPTETAMPSADEEGAAELYDIAFDNTRDIDALRHFCSTVVDNLRGIYA